MKFLPYCEECGELRVPHRFLRLSDHLVTNVFEGGPWGREFKALHGFVDTRVTNFFTPKRVKALALFTRRLGIGSYSFAPTKTDDTRTLALYEGAEKTGVTLLTFKLFGTTLCFVAEKVFPDGKKEELVFNLIPRPKNFESPSLEWMGDKALLKERLMHAGLPCAEGGVASTEAEALMLFRKIGRPVITKPHIGSRGRHTTLDVRTEEELMRAYRIATQITDGVVVEAYLKGTVHRVTLVGGKPAAVARREYPHVIGDGMHSVGELIAEENAKPHRNGTHFRHIDTEHRIHASLKKQNLTLASIPEVGEMVILNDKNSRLHGTLTEDVTDTVHEENLALFTKLGDLLGDPIVGVDFMITDMSRSWKEQPDAGFIECNSMPFIDVHHQVVSGRPINVAALLWNEVFKTPESI